MKSMSKKVIIISIVILLALLAGAGIWKWKNKPQNITEQQKQSEQNQNESDDLVTEKDPLVLEKIDTSNWQTYRNEEYGFEVKYPKDWEYDEYDGVTFSLKISQEIRKLGGSEMADEFIKQNNRGSLLVNISTYKDIKQDVGTLENWRKNNISDINKGLVKEGKYFWKNFSFSKDRVLVFLEKKYNDESIGILKYYFFHKNDGYEVSMYYSKNDDSIAKKTVETLKFDD